MVGHHSFPLRVFFVPIGFSTHPFSTNRVKNTPLREKSQKKANVFKNKAVLLQPKEESRVSESFRDRHDGNT